MTAVLSRELTDRLWSVRACRVTAADPAMPAPRRENAAIVGAKLADGLAADEARLVKRLDDGLRWLEAHRDDAGHDERFRRWLGWLRTYEAIRDALKEAGGGAGAADGERPGPGPDADAAGGAVRAGASGPGPAALPTQILPPDPAAGGQAPVDVRVLRDGGGRKAQPALPVLTIGGEELAPDPPTPDRDSRVLDRVWRWGSELANAREELAPLAQRLAALQTKLGDPELGTPEQRAVAEARASAMAKRIAEVLRGCRETIGKLVGQRSLLSDEGRERLSREWRMPEIRDGDDEALAARVWAWLGFEPERSEAA